MKYSVLMSVYAKENVEYLKLSIDSMFNQTVLPEQFVIVKDGPLTDELDAVISSYCEKYPDVMTIVSLPENVGLAKALDAGLKQCRNELVARMDSDDISLPTRCEKQINKFEEIEKLSVLGTNIDEFYDNPEEIVTSRVVPSSYDAIKKFIRRREPFNHPTIMFKKSEVLKAGGYGDLKRCQDFDLFSRMIGEGCYAENINESLLLFRSNENNYKRRKSWQSVKGNIAVVKRNYKRGYCSFFDLWFVVNARLVFFIMPTFIMKWLSNKLLRKKKR